MRGIIGFGGRTQRAMVPHPKRTFDVDVRGPAAAETVEELAVLSDQIRALTSAPLLLPVGWATLNCVQPVASLRGVRAVSLPCAYVQTCDLCPGPRQQPCRRQPWERSPPAI